MFNGKPMQIKKTEAGGRLDWWYATMWAATFWMRCSLARLQADIP